MAHQEISSEYGYGFGDYDEEDGKIPDGIKKLVKAEKDKDGVIGGLKPSEYSDMTESTTIEFTYATSVDHGSAGPMADMFLMPAGTVAIIATWLVSFSEDGTGTLCAFSCVRQCAVLLILSAGSFV